MNQITLARDVVMRGIGLHSGAMVRVVVRPGAVDTGVVFRQNGMDVPARADLVKVAPLCTLVEASGMKISTVEHLLAALHGLGIDNAVIEVEGEEIPILDGSALPWVEAFDKVGRVEQGAPKRVLVVGQAVEVELTRLRQGSSEASSGLLREEDRDTQVITAKAEPHAGAWLHVSVATDYAHPLIGPQTWRGIVDEAVFRREIAPARTFVLEKDVAAARKGGLIRGGGLDNAVVFGENGLVMNPEGLRFKDEPVRHKVLGDLYMAGRPVHGRLSFNMPGHGVNNQLLRKIV